MWYLSSWRDLRRRSNAGHGLLNKPEITPPSHSYHRPDGTHRTALLIQEKRPMADDNRYRDDDRSRNRSEDRTRSGGYGREGYGSGEHDFGDRASDEVRSWLGDDDAERRRREDERRGGGGYGPDYGSGSRSSSGNDNRGDYGRGSYGGDDNRSYGQGGSGDRRGSYGSQGEYGSYGRQGYGDQDRGVTGYRGERGFWDRASDEVSSWFGSDEAARRREQDA